MTEPLKTAAYHYGRMLALIDAAERKINPKAFRTQTEANLALLSVAPRCVLMSSLKGKVISRAPRVYGDALAVIEASIFELGGLHALPDRIPVSSGADIMVGFTSLRGRLRTESDILAAVDAPSYWREDISA